MEPESLKTRLNKALQVQSWKVDNDYKSISVLVIHWHDCDAQDAGFKDEAHAIGNLFANDFHYYVEYYPIPSSASHLSLDNKINSFLGRYGQRDNLVIIHYGGHGDADDEDDHEKLAVWAAKSSGEPKVDWSLIQPKLRFSEAHILLLFDCCFGGQAVRAPRVRTIPPNVELVAACAMGVRTIRPGPRSFTTVLIEELRNLLKEYMKAEVNDVVNGLASRYAKCRETPVHFSGFDKGKGTICLEPLNPPSTSTRTKQENALMTLKVSLRDTLNDSAITEMINWLSLLAPRLVSNLTVQDVVVSTGRVYDYIFDEDRAPSLTSFQKLSKPGKDEILVAWDKLKAHLAVIGAQLKHPSSSDDQSSQLPDIISTRDEPLRSLQEVENILLSLQRLIERHVMALPDLHEKKDVLLRAIEDMSLQDLGFLPMLELRLKARFPQELNTAMKTERLARSPSAQPKQFSMLIKEDVEGLGAVLVEYKTYGTKDATSDNIADSERRMEQLARLFQNASPADFRALRCTRWFHEANKHRFGLVFEIPTAQGEFVSLREIIDQNDRSKRPTLGQRYSIARMIGNALLRWHTADWVHQGIASYNVIFFRQNGLADYRHPYLCGFEYARPSGAPSTARRVQDFHINVYRHPSRQGDPRRYHTKKHDIYSYGVLLHEIGIWDLAEACFEDMDKRSLTATDMKEILVKHSKLRLGHVVGGAYQKAVDRCLNSDLAVDKDDAVGSQLSMNFEDLVLKAIPSGDAID